MVGREETVPPDPLVTKQTKGPVDNQGVPVGRVERELAFALNYL